MPCMEGAMTVLLRLPFQQGPNSYFYINLFEPNRIQLEASSQQIEEKMLSRMTVHRFFPEFGIKKGT